MTLKGEGMTKHRRIAAALLTMAVGATVWATPSVDGHVAIFKNVTGHVHVLRQSGPVDALPGMQLMVSDRLVSDAGASAGIVFRDGTLLTLGASSDVQVRDYVFEPRAAKYAFSVYLAKGSAIYSSGKIGKLSPESVKVDTPTSTVGVRGTHFIIEAN